jgi:hypothetical protein
MMPIILNRIFHTSPSAVMTAQFGSSSHDCDMDASNGSMST